MGNKPLLLGIVGPTASGKTSLSVSVAKALGGEILSVDSMQVYQEMDIGTAKVTAEEMQGVPHHLIDLISPEIEFNAQIYLEYAVTTISNILERHKTPIIVGGTGLYYDALTTGLSLPKHDDDPRLRERLMEEWEHVGGQQMYQKMLSLDPASAEKVHPNNKVRVIRTIELLMKTGKTLKEIAQESHSIPPKYDVLTFGLRYEDRNVLYDRINRRVDQMFSMGLEEEVKKILSGNPSKTAMNAIGYKEMKLYFDGKSTLEETKEAIKAATRRYAKRQITWFSKNKKTIWLDPQNQSLESLTSFIVDEYINSRGVNL